MKGAPRSDQFDDIYFSAEDGLAETQHVFIKANDLPHAWEGKENFTICETGFGTGLNFLEVWKVFEETVETSQTPVQTLDFISFEKYPLKPNAIKEALKPWVEHFGERIELLCAAYPLRIAGFHRIKITPQITLTLIFDDMNDAIPQLNAAINCWFLDGFTPSKNPDMWSDVLYKNMKRLSVSGARFSSFTAAGDVRRGLAAHGFSVQKKKGFGHKRDMITGVYEGEGDDSFSSFGKKIAIIGGGLAGTACAYTLKQYGFEPVIYERENALATGASGNSVGLYNPRFTAQRDAVSDFFAPAYAQLIRLMKSIAYDVGYNPCGALHLVNTPEKKKRFASLIQKWGWHEDHVALLNPKQASVIAGVPIEQDCFYLPDSGAVSPHKLCHYMAKDIEVRLLSPVDRLDSIEADAVILCNAYDAKQFIDWLPLETVRGQVTEIKTPKALEELKVNIHYGGYVSASQNGSNTLGATFQKWLDHTEVIKEDHAANISKLTEFIPFLKDKEFTIKDGRARFRTASKDRFPLVGPVPDHDHIFIAAAFGSHGLVGAVQSAHYLADLLRGGPVCLPDHTVKALAPQRFLDRMRKKQAKSP